MMQTTVSVAYNESALVNTAHGIGVPLDHCDESRSFCSAEYAASLFVPPILVARTGERKLRQLTQVVTGTPTRSSYRPQLALGAVVVAELTTRRPIMAKSLSARPSVAPHSPRLARACLSQDYILAVVGKVQAGHQMVSMGQQTIAESEASLQAIYVINRIMEEARRVDIKPAKRARNGGAR